jgi:hypothetical protein
LGSDDALEHLDAALNVMEERGVTLTPELVEREPERRPFFKTTVVAATKADASGAADRLELVRELLGDRLKLIPVSAESGEGLDELVTELFRLLDVVRVYSKVPGKDADMEAPFVLPRGSTVLDMARAVHRDLPDQLKQARVWGDSAKFDGQAVHRDQVLADKDVVELHT